MKRFLDFQTALVILWAVAILGILGIVIWGEAWGANPVLEEAEKEGVDLLYAALASAVTLGIGWLVKSPQDMRNSRKSDALMEHEKECAQRYERMDKRMSNIETDVGYIRGRLAHFMGDKP